MTRLPSIAVTEVRPSPVERSDVRSRVSNPNGSSVQPPAAYRCPSSLFAIATPVAGSTAMELMHHS